MMVAWRLDEQGEGNGKQFETIDDGVVLASSFVHAPHSRMPFFSITTFGRASLPFQYRTLEAS
jgi:hypothetical protein